MKTLLILRHAKTQPDAPAGDHARQLTERGLRDAAAMATYIHTLVGTPDAIVTSDARRALQTAEIVAVRVEFTKPLTIEPRVYAANLAVLLAVVRGLPNDADLVVFVGHNPGFEDLAAALAANHDEHVRLPTSALAHLELDVPRWDAVQPGSGCLREVATRHTIA